MPRFLEPEELGILDAPTASPFTMESVSGRGGGGAGEGVRVGDVERGGEGEARTGGDEGVRRRRASLGKAEGGSETGKS